MTKLHCMLAFAFTALVSGCSAEPTETLVPSNIEYYGDDAQLDAPSEVVQGEPFVVSITTYAGGCRSKAHTDTELVDGGVIVRPFDRENRDPDANCPAILLYDDHSVDVTLEDLGSHSIEVHGTYVDLDTEEERVWTLPVNVVAATN